MGIPNPHVLTELLIEYLFSRKQEWETMLNKSRSVVDNVQTKKTTRCTDLNSTFYSANRQLADNLKDFQGWIEIISKISNLAREEWKSNPDSALFDYLHAMRTYIIDELSEKPCVVMSSDTIPTMDTLNKFPSPSYVFSNKKLFYINLGHENKLTEVKADKTEELFSFLSPTEKPQLLKKEQAKKIESLADHIHDKLTDHIDSLLETKHEFEKEITTLEIKFALMVEENKSSKQTIDNLQVEINKQWQAYEQTVTQLIDLGHIKTIAKAQLYGFFNGLEFPNDKEHFQESKKLDINLNYFIPLQYQPGYFKLHYKLWCQPNTEIDLETFKKYAKNTEVSMPMNRKDAAVWKKTKFSTATGSIVGFVSATTNMLSGFAGSLANNFSSSNSSAAITDTFSLQRKFY